MANLDISLRYIPIPETGCWLYDGYWGTHGYGMANRAGSNPQCTHRMAYEEAYGPIPAGMHVLHKCDTRPCINPLHLSLGTNADNVADMMRKGRQQRANGEAHSQAKLTLAQVKAIRASNTPRLALAKEYGVHVTTIDSIIKGKTWKAALAA